MTAAWLLFIAVGMWASLHAPHWPARSLAGRALSDVIEQQAVVLPTHNSSVRASNGRPIDLSGAGHPSMLVAAASAFAAAIHVVLPLVSTTYLPAACNKLIVAQPRAPPADRVTNPAYG